MNPITAYTLNLTVRRVINYPMLALIAVGVIGALAGFPLSYLAGMNVLIGLCLFPFSFFIQGAKRFNVIYFLVLIVFTMLALWYDIKLFYFFAVAFYFILLVEIFIGRVNKLVLFLVGFMSPAFLQISVIFGFPIRLMLSQWACAMLETFGMNAHADGNIIMLDGSAFAVDEACMGLNMLAISLLMGVFVLIHHYKITRKTLPFYHLTLFFSVLFVLNLVANLFRIITLVVFRILPTDPLHEPAGILCLIVYTLVPMYFLSCWLVRWGGKSIAPDLYSAKKSSRFVPIVAVAGVAILCSGFIINPTRAEIEQLSANVSMGGMKTESMEGGITKLYNDTQLVYVKTIPEFFTGEHTPLLCWKGSGYEFKHVKEESVNGLTIFTGLLVKDSTKLYTAWWYTNGSIETIDQFTWRVQMIKDGKPFYLINVTAADEDSMLVGVDSILREKNLTITDQ